jgi:hypothetical protein
VTRIEDPPPQSVELNNVSCDWVQEHAAGHALRSLDPVDADKLDGHLLLCAPCETELGNLSLVTSLLGISVPQVDPPASIKQHLMASLRSPVALEATPLVVPAIPAVPASTPLPVQTPPARSWLSGRLLLAPLIGALLLVGFWAIGTQERLETRDSEVARLERENAALTVHLSSIQAGQQAYGNSGVWYPLSNSDANPGGAGGIVMSGSQNTTTLLSVWNMPLEHDSYHVICESKLGELLAAGQIQVNDHGSGSVTLTLPAPVSEYRAVHVVPTDSMPDGVADLTKDILQLLLSEPTAVATRES